MKSVVAASALALTLLGSSAWAQTVSPMVALFTQGASLSNAFEIEESKIILEDSTDPALRAFARQMVHDHGMAQAELDRAAQPSGAPTSFVFDNDRKKQVDALGLMDGQKLDQTYVADQTQAHAQAVALLSGYAQSGEDPMLRAWARATLPTVLEHQRMLAEITGVPPVM